MHLLDIIALTGYQPFAHPVCIDADDYLRAFNAHYGRSVALGELPQSWR